MTHSDDITPTPSDPRARCQAIVLAAGRGQRFDPSGQSFKLNHRLDDGRSVLSHTLQTVSQVFSHYQVITNPHVGFDDEVMQKYATHMRVCPDAGLGMGHSLAFGVAQLPKSCDAVFIVLADMPWLSASTLCSLRDHMLRCLDEKSATIVVPSFQGQRGHPVGFARCHFAELRALSSDQGARAVLQAHVFDPIAVEDAGVVRDVDTLADLQAQSN